MMWNKIKLWRLLVYSPVILIGYSLAINITTGGTITGSLDESISNKDLWFWTISIILAFIGIILEYINKVIPYNKKRPKWNMKKCMSISYNYFKNIFKKYISDIFFVMSGLVLGIVLFTTATHELWFKILVIGTSISLFYIGTFIEE